jgi:hypothetical protein
MTASHRDQHAQHVMPPREAPLGVAQCDQLRTGRSERCDVSSGRARLAAGLVRRDETGARQLLHRHPPAVAQHLDLDDEPSSPRRARLFVKAACQDWQLDAVCDDAMLVASELVGNAVAHAHTTCRLDIRLDTLGLTIAVRDHDYRGLLNPLACSSAGQRDHGLFLVASISRAWGVDPTENGKCVWALLSVAI